MVFENVIIGVFITMCNPSLNLIKLLNEASIFCSMANFIKLAIFRYIGKHSKTLAFS